MSSKAESADRQLSQKSAASTTAPTTNSQQTVKNAKKPAAKNPVSSPATASKNTSVAPASKAVVKKAASPAAKKTVGAPAKAVVSTPASAKPPVVKTPVAKALTAKMKTEKVKMERDSFTMPKDEYAQIAILKKRLETLGKPVKKSELLRAGLKLLAGMNDVALQAGLAAIPVIKTGRPKKKH